MLHTAAVLEVHNLAFGRYPDPKGLAESSSLKGWKQQYVNIWKMILVIEAASKSLRVRKQQVQALLRTTLDPTLVFLMNLRN